MTHCRELTDETVVTAANIDEFRIIDLMERYNIVVEKTGHWRGPEYEEWLAWSRIYPNKVVRAWPDVAVVDLIIEIEGFK